MYAVATKSATDGLIQLFDDLVRCETRLYNAISETLRREHGIATSQYEFLRYFRDHPGSRIADVATNFAAGIGAISKGVDRLEARGWVTRHPNPADGRSSLVSLTPAGAELVAEAESTFRERLAELVSPAMTPSDIDATGPVLARLRTALESSRVGLPVG
ncbi:DNA-binding transcriptional regulator, MarR family [Leifsonia sp. 98AMF]|uniref:MarR family winged helix-turn-helix transcriptional regulator n=1 Tax=unclassified Leifsonia TaxID=2663824 RepID=UPI00087CCE0A|nr:MULTISPECIES: MarR family transcriptional regulator [unclassified Leifsonia]SDH09841.1 DNA-binding transcriptional regulator, MarR family [Leifsonia sp. 197AMF]SDK51192.1 DNA-binding transcriptional regulator, MarR family [Leifsonia sp. 157MF]SEN59024.1 DNA-binding transcriptional regulator, MarR family [Leifsonia sp. 467MF]SDJ29396.1 DNA-binding transcriptional regulator, MarR family [Leifsonia sp. 466MF]SDN51212.1 DNA-binding transcriptional regulator, MarR family [Leifsonia sp. 509MF]